MTQGLRCVASRPEVHTKWFGRRRNAEIETSGRDAAQILASYYKPAFKLYKGCAISCGGGCEELGNVLVKCAYGITVPNYPTFHTAIIVCYLQINGLKLFFEHMHLLSTEVAT